MRWLVDCDSHPAAHAPSRMAHAQPPGPGFPEHAPSVYTVVLTPGSWPNPAVLRFTHDLRRVRPPAARHRHRRNERVARQLRRQSSRRTARPGPGSCCMKLLERARELQVGFPATVSTPYINTIPPEQEPWFPGDELHGAPHPRLHPLERGGHGHPGQLASRRHRRPPRHLRLVGVAVRGRLQPLLPRQGRRQAGRPGVLPGPRRARHLRPRLPRGSARPRTSSTLPHGAGRHGACRAIRTRGSCPTSGSSRPSRWASGRSRPSTRPASTATCSTAGSPTPASRRSGASWATARATSPSRSARCRWRGREQLDNLIFVVNCNLQRLDGPVRGNGKIIQELETVFRGAGWNVIKVIWGSKWDELLARDVDGVLVNKMNTTVDGEFQKYAVESGAYIREHFFGPDPRLRKLVEHLSDEELRKRCPAAATTTASSTPPTRPPSSTRVRRRSSWPRRSRAGRSAREIEARNATHQIKKMTKDQLSDAARPSLPPRGDPRRRPRRRSAAVLPPGRRLARRTST